MPLLTSPSSQFELDASASLSADADADASADGVRLAKPRAALVVHREIGNLTRFLLISSSNNPAKLTLPGGKIGKGETALATAVRETAEEAGVLTDRPAPLGVYLHSKGKRRIHPTQTFVAAYAGQLAEYEPRAQYWLTLQELLAVQRQVRKPIRLAVIEASKQVRIEKAAA